MKALFWLWISGMIACWEAIVLRPEAPREPVAADRRPIDLLGGR